MLQLLAATTQTAVTQHGLQIFGIRLVGVNSENGKKLLFSIGLIFAFWILGRLLRAVAGAILSGLHQERVRFWTKQAISLGMAVFLIIGLLSIWFDDPTRLGTFFGLVTAGLAFALQRVITAVAGYFVILRGKTFNVGDRITMGGVRGDVLALGFLQTTIMEMGQPPPVQNADPAMWVRARQYSGRIVTVTNAKVFDEPIFNYTREFPFIWEEMSIPVGYKSDWRKAEQILLDAARENTQKIEDLAEPDLHELERRYSTRRAELHPRVYLRMTDNWIELTVRFIVKDHAVRDIKDAMGRHILRAFLDNHIDVASGTYDIVGLPNIKVELENPTPPPPSPSTAGRHLPQEAPSAASAPHRPPASKELHSS